MHNVGDLSDEELLARLRAHAGKGHVWHAQLLAYLAEVEDRRLDRLQACTSIWDFCLRKLGMSESEAQRRITAARIIRRFPHVLGRIERGELHLCALYALRKHLTSENVDALVREACGKSTRDLEKMIASRFPRPDVAPRVEPVAPQTALRVVTSGEEPASPWSLSLADSPPAEPRPRVEPLSATRYRIELTVSAETSTKLQRIMDLMRHRNPSGDLEKIVDASLDLLLAKLEKERLGKTARPRNRRDVAESETSNATSHNPRDVPESETSSATFENDTPTGPSDLTSAHATTSEAAIARAHEAPSTQDVRPANRGDAEDRTRPARAKRSRRPRYISREVRRQVFARDGEQCTYRDGDGHRCPARGFLELDHIHARALGGGDTEDNLRVRCRGHNALYAEQVFGRAHVEQQIDLQRRKYGPPSSPQLETVTRALRWLGFTDAEVRRALPIVAKKLDDSAQPEMIIREALLVLT